MTHAGIDYGLVGQTNRNRETGIHYGVISQHSVTQAWADSAEPNYGDPTCPKCGKPATDSSILVWEAYDAEKHAEYSDTREGYCADYACTHCEITFDSSEAYPEDPLSWHYTGEGYTMESCLDSDIMVLKSPYYTRAVFCSPCVPGAGDLNNPHEDGVKTYCLGHDWFEDGKAPYRVFRVADDSEVMPERSAPHVG